MLDTHTHSSLDPDRLTARQGSHLLHVGEIELARLGSIIRRKHVLLPRLSKQAFNSDLAPRQSVRTCPWIAVLLVDPATVD